MNWEGDPSTLLYTRVCVANPDPSWDKLPDFIIVGEVDTLSRSSSILYETGLDRLSLALIF